ncbi:beta-1,4-N-acetylgalactosaminyltransferase 3-like [Hoplias malabaricus]|uniref:beta-1,4-N-acetylgalactosaminyltransferase 3-like n=1 Tax=Hoplias malabaricus TaxID=27720 RepID=UPI003462A6A5
MKLFYSGLAGLFSFRKMRKCILFIFLSTIIFIICLALFHFHMQHKNLDPDKVHFLPSKALLSFLHQSNRQKTDEMTEVHSEQSQWEPKYRGRVNMHVFEDWCGSSVEQLRKNTLFPRYPHIRTTVTRLAIYPKWTHYGVRIFGYLHPADSGEYRFAISSDKNSEFWLSENESLHSIRLLAYVGKTGQEWAGPGEYWKFVSQISQPVLLKKGKRYFFEVLFKHSEGIDHVEVAWRLNQRNSSFTVITSEYLSLYANESSSLKEDSAHIAQTTASNDWHVDHISRNPEPYVDMVREDPRDTIYNLPLLNESHLRKLFPECDYKPINVFEGGHMQRYHGIYHVHYSAVYPNDHTRQTHTAADEMCFYNKDKTFTEGGGFLQFLKIESTGTEADKKPNWERVINVNPVDFYSNQPIVVTNTCKRAGNVIMNEKDVKPVIEAFMATVNKSDLALKRVLNVEKRVDGDAGARYFLELELEDGKGQNLVMSKYFYVTTNKGNPDLTVLCSPQGFSWNPEARVHVILTVKNQGRWVIHFIQQMEKIYQTTGDKNFNIIIVDYSSNDADIDKALKNAQLPSYQYKRLEGTFLKTTAIQTAIDLVEDENSILFTCDLHLNFPLSIINTVRKHCVQGKMIFAPVVMRLDCGASAQAPTGFWEISGYGLIGIYKSDMDRIGGMNTKDFKDKWGGEDWELLDRILENKLEVERINLRNFLHYHHSKRGMWNS